MKENDCIFSEICLKTDKKNCSKHTCEKYGDYSDFPEYFKSEDDIIDEIF